jgi:lipoate-protein ligase A
VSKPSGNAPGPDTLTPATLVVLQTAAGDPGFNMALDEVLLVSAASLAHTVLRFYSWTQPAASFGYFQRYSEVEQLTSLRPLVRRPTGGGVVPHDRDWTYSVAFAPDHPWYSFAAVESYRLVHEWLRNAFARMSISTQLAPESRKAGAGQCFEGYEKSDLLWHGKKIAGAAQRRTKQGLLIQGSIQPPPVSLNRRDWETAMLECIPGTAASGWKILVLPASLILRAEELARAKYSERYYNLKR